MLTVRNVSVSYGKERAVSDVSFTVRPGQWWMLAGPNGAGKSTLVKAVSAGAAFEGSVLVDGAEARALKPAQLARKIGVLAQYHSLGYGFTVEQVVSMGRYAYQSGFLGRGDGAGAEKVLEALQMTGMTSLRDHNMLTLSGGEMQRAFLAQVFCQDPELMILDEPSNHLDLPYQKQLFSLIGQWLQTPGRAVVSVVHDLSLAKMYGTHGLLMDHGRLAAGGEINTVMTRENLNAVYGMDVYQWMSDMLSQWKDEREKAVG